ncbi:MAG: capsule biosynthesis protein, partial [Pseudomonadota bacterium]
HKQFAVRQARRMGLGLTDPNAALHKLAEMGVNIFANDEKLLDLATDARAKEAGAQVPAKKKETPPAPKRDKRVAKKAGADVLMEPEDAIVMKPAGEERDLKAEREQEIARIQRELVTRRRNRFMAMLLRLAVFVMIPTGIVGLYSYLVATDMYATDSEFVIQTAEAGVGATELGSLIGLGSATSQDSVVVQGYLTSREAFLRLQSDYDYVEHFKNPAIDAIQRLPEDATLDDAYSLFGSHVNVGYDPSEGVIRMTVIATSPEASQTFSQALIRYAEDRVDGLTLEARGDQLRDALARRDQAERELLSAQERIVSLQQAREVLSPEVELQATMGIINTLQLQLENRRLELRQLLANPRPNQSRADVLRAEIVGYESRINELRAELTQPDGSSTSLAGITAELRLAELELATKQIILEEAISGAEAAQIKADQQTRYISVGVAPIAPIGATYPRKLENTLLAFIVFSGIYILGSLTYSILREQVSL